MLGRALSPTIAVISPSTSITNTGGWRKCLPRCVPTLGQRQHLALEILRSFHQAASCSVVSCRAVLFRRHVPAVPNA
jgi:hypothetical protein